MNQWYYSSNGKAQGPVTSEFLIENLRKGQMTLVDLVFRAGDAGWVTVGEIPEFREAYNALPLQVPPMPTHTTESSNDQMTITLDDVAQTKGAAATPVNEPFEIHAFKKMISMSDSRSVQPLARPQSGWPRDWQLSSSWVVLKRREDGSGFDQDGPFSAEQIIEMIGQGKVEYSQYCWKPGYTRWFRIGNLPEFDRRKRDRDNDTVNQIVPVPEIQDALPALTREELLSGVERLRQARRQQESAPAGTDGRDLVRNAIDVTPVSTSHSPVAPVSQPAAEQRTLGDFGEPRAWTPGSKPSAAPQAPVAEPRAWTPPKAAPAAQIEQTSAQAAAATEPAQSAQPTPIAWTKATASTYADSQAPNVSDEIELGDVPEPKPWTPSAKMTSWTPNEHGTPAQAPHQTQAPSHNPYPFADSGAQAHPGVMKPAVQSNRSYVRLGVAGGIASLVVIALLQYSSNKQAPEETPRTPAAKPIQKKTEPAAESREQIPNPGETGSVAPVAPPTVAQNPGSTLEILPLKLSTEPSLTFQTDAGVGQTINVSVSAKTGEILRYGSYSNTFQVTRSSGEIPTLNLSNSDLPSGTYTVLATVGSAKAEKEIFIGVKGSEFSSQLERHIKGLSYRQQVERKSMHYGSQKLASLTMRLIEKSKALKGQPKAWKKELASWRLAAKEASMPVLQLAAAPKNEAAYYPQLSAFQLAAEKLAAAVNEVDSAMEQKREIASADLDSVMAAFSEIQGETAALSGRPKP